MSAIAHRMPGKKYQTTEPKQVASAATAAPSIILLFLRPGRDHVRRRVHAGREFEDALREVLTANAELLVLWRKQQPPR